MKAIILAAGYGRRMRPFTDIVHKTLIDVNGSTIIDRIMEALLQHSINDIVIVTGYMHDALTSYLSGKYPQVNFTYVYNERFRETNNIYSMALAFEKIKIDKDIILIESDLVIEPAVLTRLIKSPYKNVALVDHFRTGMDGTVVTVENNIVTNVIPPHLQPENFDFSDKFKTLNIYKFSKEFCETFFKKLLTYYARVIDDNCYYELILGILIYMQRETIHAEIIDQELWAEVDDPNDLEEVKFLFHKSRKEILQKQFGGYWNYNIIDFCFIRNMYFPTSAIISEIKNTLPALIHNYGSRQSVLNQKLAWFLLCNKNNVRAINGASQIYPILRILFLDKKILIPSPTFGEYPRIFKNAPTYTDEIGIHFTEIEEKSHACDVVVFVNPNNPTGSEFSSETIYTYALNNPQKTIIVDESFIEFSQYPSIITFLEKRPVENILVIKSLSKSLGIPGVRLGYIYSCNAALLKQIDSHIPIWNMNSVAEFFLEIILKHRNALSQSIKQTIFDRDQFCNQLRSVGFIEEVFPSGGNFILVSLGKNAPEPAAIVDSLLNDNNIYIKDVSDRFTIKKGKYLRFAVRLPEEIEKLTDCLRKLE